MFESTELSFRGSRIISEITKTKLIKLSSRNDFKLSFESTEPVEKAGLVW